MDISHRILMKLKNNTLHMTRCDYDAVFYRVFYITLLAIAFTFTVILTNVFIDIDGLLSNKQGKHKAPVVPTEAYHEVFTHEPMSDDFNYGDSDDSYRTKRSIGKDNFRNMETQNFLFHIKNPKIKNILTNRLSTLLEALDAEESNNLRRERIKTVPKEEDKIASKDVLTIVDDGKEQDEKVKRQKDEDMLHLTMHNILLQGIIGHMDLKEVYKRVNSLMKNLNNVRDDLKGKVNRKSEDKEDLTTTQSDETKPQAKPSIEDKFVAELIKCNKLQEHIMSGAVKNDARKTSLDIPRSSLIDPRVLLRSGPENIPRMPIKMPPKAPEPDIAINTKLGSNVLIKTVIDIKSLANNQSDTISNDNVRGMIELIYNGKSIKFTRPDAELKQSFQKKPTLNVIQPKFTKVNRNLIPEPTTTQATIINFNDLKKIPKDYLNRFVTEYFKRYPRHSKETSEETKEKFETKRLKRHIKIKYEKEENTSHMAKRQAINKNKKKTEDDELYVEIETHFDSKGMKGEKKKKLIRSLIEKIQKAIHSDESKKPDGDVKRMIKKKKHASLHVRKRLQNPLEHNEPAVYNKYTIPLSSIVHRQLNPITIPKTISMQENSPNVRDRSGESWKKEYIGPTFLTATKSINSAEMSELDVDYNKVMDVNGIPQRLQKPLNTDMSEESMNSNAFYDLGNMKFFIKDIDGSGFSIGFNQYVDEPPDPETIKLFTGLENVIKTYHQNYDQAQEQTTDDNWELNDRQETAPNMNDHIIVRRSINKKHDYHSNEYKIIYDGPFLPYDNYKDIYERDERNSKTNIEFRTSKDRETPLVVDENIFEKNLKPAEIFGLANLFERKKRSLNVKKISNLKGKIKLNRYLNTKAMSTKRIFLNKKRSKRQINKIRIIASDLPHKHSSDENVFVVSDENVFADRAIVKEVETTELEPEKPDDSEYIPYQPDESETPTYRIFDGKSRHNPLMSKYPHIFMEEISKSREDFTPDNALLFGKIPAFSKLASQNMDMDKVDDKNIAGHSSSTPSLTDVKNTDPTEKIERVQDIVNALQAPKTNYKVTVKIVPKNMSSGLNSGFKEIHTSINKRFNKNGLMYSSLVNVSEISKVIKINKTKEPDFNKAADAYLAKKIKDQQEKMQVLLRQHQKHIDEQLNRLNEEKTNIESILVDENNTIVPHFDYLDMLMPTKTSHKVLHLSKDDVNKFAAESLRVKEPVTTLAPITTLTTPKTVPLTTITTTPTPPPVFNDKLKKNIMHTIERNENLTDQILKKIDKNTEILQTFLKKLTDKMTDTAKLEHKLPPKEEEKTEKPVPKFEPAKFDANKFDPNKFDTSNAFPIDWRNHPGMPFSPNMIIRKNDSHISIPFVYAYQQPILPHKSNTPVASVVYHGHIHTNTIHTKDAASAEKEKVQPMHKVLEPNNQTRFFIDELESDYKVIPVTSIKKGKMHKNSTIT